MAKKPLKNPADEPAYDGWMIGLGVGVVVLGIVWVAMHVGSPLSMNHQKVPNNPVDIVIRLFQHKLTWTRGATVVAVVLIGIGVAAWRLYRAMVKRRGAGALPVDSKAEVMATGGALEALKEKAVKAKADDLGMRLGFDDAPGVPIGMSVADGVMLYGSYEDLHLDIWGPRQGKTTSRVIPAILDAPGACIVTSNKRDVVDATRDVREAHNHKAYVFDPQGVAGSEPSWFWDPISWVRGSEGDLAGAEVRAARLAGHFADADGDRDARGDAFFDPEGEDLLSGLILAAAYASPPRPITQVWEWISNPQNDEPVHILRRVHDRYPPAAGLAGQYNADPRTKSGIFGTAKKMARALRLTAIEPWVTNKNGGEQFDELDFLSRGGTLYCLSLEGRGSAAPLVSALTEAVLDVAMRSATNLPGGRLDRPLVAVLDEAANVVRWKDLPKQYSHFGSRGIVVMTVLQSWAQGVRCWGKDGMDALWAAANIRVIGSGVDHTDFLRERSEAIGEYDVISKSVSKSGKSKSISSSMASSKTFTVSDLISMPRGRVIVFPSGGKPALVKTVPWWEGPYADEVKAAVAKQGPRQTTMADLVEERETMIDDQTDREYVREVPSL